MSVTRVAYEIETNFEPSCPADQYFVTVIDLASKEVMERFTSEDPYGEINYVREHVAYLEIVTVTEIVPNPVELEEEYEPHTDEHTTEEHIYNRIAKVANCSYARAERACEKAREDGLAVQTYADAEKVYKALVALRHLVPNRKAV